MRFITILLVLSAVGSESSKAEETASTISSKCLIPLMKMIEQAERNGRPASNVVPVECQYYRVHELDQNTQKRLITVMKGKSKPISSEKKLSEIFGLLINDDDQAVSPPQTGVENTSNVDEQECEKALLNLNEIRKRYYAKVDATKTDVECSKIAGSLGFHDNDIIHSTCGKTTYGESSPSFRQFCEEHKEDFLSGGTLPKSTLLSDMLGKLPFTYNSVALDKCKSKR